MAARTKKTKIERLELLARSLPGQVLAEWLEDIVRTYADVRNVPTGVSYEVRREAVLIIEEEIIKQLKYWAREDSTVESGGDME